MYFDHAATSPMKTTTRKKLFTALQKPYANFNSQHQQGKETAHKTQEAITAIKKALHLQAKHDIIFTSGATEANNLVLKSVVSQTSRNHVIISPFEHDSVRTVIASLQQQGLKVSIAPVDDQGQIILNELLDLITFNTCLISIASCESELGIRQDIVKISQQVKQHAPHVLIHSDMTQSIYKLDLEYGALDFASFSGHKLGSMVGIGGLICFHNFPLRPQIHGGKSYSLSRAGTFPYELLLSLRFALTEKHDIDIIHKQKEQVLKQIAYIPNIIVNQVDNCSPYILNLSILNKKRHVSQALLSRQKVFISLGSACSNTRYSNIVARLFNQKRAETAIRISFDQHDQVALKYLIRQIKELAK